MSGTIWIILGILAAAFASYAIPHGFNLRSQEHAEESGTMKVRSNNQSGGITAGNIETINIKTNQEDGAVDDSKQKKTDAHTALIYQTEISHFLTKFKTCLRWTLPTSNHGDAEIDAVFNYGINYTKAIDIENLSKQIIVKIFIKYDFAKPMANYVGDADYQPTGFNNFLGILQYLDAQLEKHLNKYGSSTSSDLTMRIEYMQRLVQSTISSIRMDMQTTGKISEQAVNGIADLMFKMREDFILMKESYTNGMSGGYPIIAGKVLKSHKTEGSIMVETQLSKY